LAISVPSITAEQILDSILAVPAFTPVTVCTGYLAGWFTNLHGFRQRSLVERCFWSIPLSLSISTIGAVLIAWSLSITTASILFLVAFAIWLITLGREWLRLRHADSTWHIGWRPLGNKALFLAVLWAIMAVLLLVDIQSDQRLFMSLPVFDHAARTNWTESILRTGIPPANSLYYYKQAAPMRYYYFWLVDCAVVATISHLPVRAVLVGGCVWAGFAMAALTGLFLKHVLAVGERLREQFLLAISLFAVSGVYVCVELWNVLVLHIPPPGDRWSWGQLVDWLTFFLLDPHHLASFVCCMLAFLLASTSGRMNVRSQIAAGGIIAASLASAFGLSVYVAFAFFLNMLVWSAVQVVFKKSGRPVILLAAGGAGAFLLLIPYLWQITHSASRLGGGSVFGFFVRETIPPDRLLSLPIVKGFAANHAIARDLANVLLLIPGYAIELGFYFLVLLIFLVRAWRGRMQLSPAHRSLLCICLTTIPIMSLIRSGVLKLNDFGLHSPLFLQFSLLLLASEFLITLKARGRIENAPAIQDGSNAGTPEWLRSLATLAIFVGVLTMTAKAVEIRLILPYLESKMQADLNPQVHNLSHKAYISRVGYSRLGSHLPQDAIVQFNPAGEIPWWTSPDLMGIQHQTAAAFLQLWCGSELGGDPSGCPDMAAAIDSIYRANATVQRARSTCRQFQIQYLVANVYDPVWNDKESWVWTLNPVVADPEFRVLDCRDDQQADGVTK
jgi:hypothetical protein